MGLIIVFNNCSITVSAVTSVATQPPSYIIILCKKNKDNKQKKHFISLLVLEMHCVIFFFFLSSGTSNHTKGVIRFQEGSEHPSSHSFSSHLH